MDVNYQLNISVIELLFEKPSWIPSPERVNFSLSCEREYACETQGLFPVKGNMPGGNQASALLNLWWWRFHGLSTWQARSKAFFPVSSGDQ